MASSIHSGCVASIPFPQAWYAQAETPTACALAAFDEYAVHAGGQPGGGGVLIHGRASVDVVVVDDLSIQPYLDAIIRGHP